MQTGKKILLAAGLLAGAAAMTGCSADMRAAATPTPNAQQVTAAPVTAQPAQDMQGTDAQADAEEAPEPLVVRIGEEELRSSAIEEDGKLLLPLVETAQALGFKVNEEQTQEETQTKRVVTLDKEESRITVSWTVSDNTAKGITWQKDGLLIPVDTYLTTEDDVVYAPSAFFEEAMDVTVDKTQNGVNVAPVQPSDTPEKQEQALEGNG